jgi:hypothetical protein
VTWKKKYDHDPTVVNHGTVPHGDREDLVVHLVMVLRSHGLHRDFTSIDGNVSCCAGN